MRTIRRSHGCECRLLGNGSRIMHERFDARSAKPSLQRGALACANREQMIHVSAVDFRWNINRRAFEQRSITGCEHAPLVRASAQGGKARPKNRSLHLIEPAVDADLDMAISISLPAVAQPRDACGECRIARDNRAAVAEGPEIFCRVEAERTGGPKDAHRLARAGCEMRLTAIF